MRTITAKGNELHLTGRMLEIGDEAPDFTVVGEDMQEIRLRDFGNKIKLLTTFPSLDTSTCQMQVKTFNQKAGGFDPDVVVVGISRDLPFAQKRFCEMNNITGVIAASDYRYASFGLNYGLLVRETRLLARAIVIADKNNVVRYRQIVPELSREPDYDDAMRELQKVVKDPAGEIKRPLPVKCTPCEAGTPPLPGDEIMARFDLIIGWELAEDQRKLRKEYRFRDFADAKLFVDLLSLAAEEQGHHPVITWIYNKIKITLTTHASQGLTENDFIMAGLIDGLINSWN
ncbi:thiol peroxidase [candidate division FCPU426 bacterium]|nr:thiol peroxidase [candidate division FCPU426 bacterium]